METILPAPILTHLFSIRCQVDPRVETRPGPLGSRRCMNIKGGTVAGTFLQGEVSPGGADFLYVSHLIHTSGL